MTKVSGELVVVDVSLIFAAEVINGCTRLHFHNSSIFFDVRESIDQIIDSNPPYFEFYVA